MVVMWLVHKEAIRRYRTVYEDTQRCTDINGHICSQLNCKTYCKLPLSLITTWHRILLLYLPVHNILKDPLSGLTHRTGKKPITKISWKEIPAVKLSPAVRPWPLWLWSMLHVKMVMVLMQSDGSRCRMFLSTKFQRIVNVYRNKCFR